MTRLFLAAGVAALAIAAPVSAEKGGKGEGDKGQSAKVERGGGGGGNAESRGGGQDKAERRGPQRAELSARGEARSEARAERRANRVELRARAHDRRVAKVENRGHQEARTHKAERKLVREQRAEQRVERRTLRIVDRDLDQRRFSLNDDDWSNPGVGCPPGLSNRPLCLPPGQYKKLGLGQLLPAAYSDQLIPLGLRDFYQDDDDHYYRLGDGYVYRVDRDTNLVAALLPLLGGGLGIGQLFPTTYMNSFAPDHYQSFYPDSDDDYYRYANGYVYEIDRNSGLIEGIIPMYANGYGVGQMLPPSYSYYNVPTQYRDFYSDSDDHYYRYAPGAIYQVDRSTNLITAIASLLAGDLGVGQQLPMSYSAYNVPLQYRDRYYDTADNWYRYNDGNIYQVDPTTRLITAVIQALV